MSNKSLYLIFYNLLQLLGRTLFLLKVTIGLIKSKSLTEIFEETIFLLALVQYASILEIFHTFYKLVKAVLCIVMVENLGRIAIVATLQFCKNSISNGYLLIYVGWSVLEIVRYFFDLLLLVKRNNKNFDIPYFLIWLRYSLFIILYPIGVSGEVITVWNARYDFNNYSLIGIPISFLLYPLFILYFICLIYLYIYLFKVRSITLKKIGVKKNDKTE